MFIELTETLFSDPLLLTLSFPPQQLRIKFNEEEDDVFEYPSEAFLLKTYDAHDEAATNGFKSIGDEDEPKGSPNNENQPPPVPKRSKNSKLTSPPASSLKNNTIIGALNGKWH